MVRIAGFDRVESGPQKKNSLFRKSKEGQKFTVMSQIRATLLSGWANILLALVPAGFAVRYTMGLCLTTFLLNFVAIIPLSFLADYAVSELIMRIGDSWGGLAYITIRSVSALCARVTTKREMQISLTTPSNTVQIISSIFLLKNKQLQVLQTNLIGGILCTVLLILGFSIFFGGVNRMSQSFNLDVAHISANLLSLAATSLLIPTASHLLSQSSAEHIVRQSRVAAFVLILVYFAFIVFQFYSHTEVWGAPIEKHAKRGTRIEPGAAIKGLANSGAWLAASVGGPTQYETLTRDPFEPDDQPQLSKWVMLGFLIIVVTLTAFCTQFAVDSIDALSQKANLSKTFIGLILLPILNNDTTPITHAIKDNLHQTMNYTIGKCLQTALLVTPVMVLIAWGMHLELTLNFDGFEIVSLFASVLLVNYLIIDGKSNW